MNIKNEAKELIVFVLIVLSAAATFSYMLFGTTGIRVVAGNARESFPFYIFFNHFELGEGEKFVFSILLGLTIFPSLVYILGLVISFRLGIVLSFIVFLAAAFLPKYKQKRTKN